MTYNVWWDIKPCSIKQSWLLWVVDRLSVPVQLIAWKGSSLKWRVTYRVGCQVLLSCCFVYLTWFNIRLWQTAGMHQLILWTLCLTAWGRTKGRWKVAEGVQATISDKGVYCSDIPLAAVVGPFSSNRQHLSYDGCLEKEGRLSELFCVVLYTLAHLDKQFLQISGIRFISFHCA